MEDKRERYAKYLTELQKIDPSDSQIESKVNSALARHNILDRHTAHEVVPRMTPHAFPFFAGYNDPFYRFEKRISDVFTNFDKHFSKMDEVDFASLEKELPATETEKPSHNSDRAYCKYSSSFTSFDSSGQKKSKSISGVEKVIDGKRYVSKRKRTIDGNNMVEEQFYPDGRKVVTTKSLDKLGDTLKAIE